MLALDAGAAWFDGTGGFGQGTVRAVFGPACYLQFGDGLLALCRSDVASGPLHLRVPALPALRAGDPVRIEPGRLVAGALVVAIRPELRWVPEPVAAADLLRAASRSPAPDPGFTGLEGPARLSGRSPAPDPGVTGLEGLARHRGADRRWSPASPTGLTGLVDNARELVAGRDLVGLARLVGGRGPGLTPAGDDLLAGVLVVDSLLHPDDLAFRQAAAQTAVTTDVAAAFLHWAARGQCIEPFHTVISAMAAGHRDREAAARARLRKIGASSGEALLLGLDLAMTSATGA